MYFLEQALNDKDLLLQQKNQEEQEAMIAKLDSRAPTGEKIYRYDIVLGKVKQLFGSNFLSQNKIYFDK